MQTTGEPGKGKGRSVVIDLKSFFLSDGLSEALECRLDLSGMELGGVKPFCAPVCAHVRLTGFGGSVELRAEVGYTLTMPCDRCFEEVTRHFSSTFAHTLVRQLHSGGEDGDYVLVEDERLDLDRLLQEDILLDLPSKFLCRPDCEGLCPTCGKNRNEGPCGCSGREIDPRLAVLQELL